jgi:hypothetical protein
VEIREHARRVVFVEARVGPAIGDRGQPLQDGLERSALPLERAGDHAGEAQAARREMLAEPCRLLVA